MDSDENELQFTEAGFDESFGIAWGPPSAQEIISNLRRDDLPTKAPSRRHTILVTSSNASTLYETAQDIVADSELSAVAPTEYYTPDSTGAAPSTELDDSKPQNRDVELCISLCSTVSSDGNTTELDDSLTPDLVPPVVDPNVIVIDSEVDSETDYDEKLDSICDMSVSKDAINLSHLEQSHSNCVDMVALGLTPSDGPTGSGEPLQTFKNSPDLFTTPALLPMLSDYDTASVVSATQRSECCDGDDLESVSSYVIAEKQYRELLDSPVKRLRPSQHTVKSTDALNLSTSSEPDCDGIPIATPKPSQRSNESYDETIPRQIRHLKGSSYMFGFQADYPDGIPIATPRPSTRGKTQSVLNDTIDEMDRLLNLEDDEAYIESVWTDTVENQMPIANNSPPTKLIVPSMLPPPSSCIPIHLRTPRTPLQTRPAGALVNSNVTNTPTSANRCGGAASPYKCTPSPVGHYIRNSGSLVQMRGMKCRQSDWSDNDLGYLVPQGQEDLSIKMPSVRYKPGVPLVRDVEKLLRLPASIEGLVNRPVDIIRHERRMLNSGDGVVQVDDCDLTLFATTPQNEPDVSVVALSRTYITK